MMERIDGEQMVAAGEQPRPDTALEATPDRRARFDDPENWHDLAERGTPRNG